MKRVLLAILLVPAIASGRPVAPPAGWTTDPSAAISMSKRLADLEHFGGLRSLVTTEVYRAPGASLFVTRASASVAGLDEANRNKAATTEANELLLAPLRGGAKLPGMAEPARPMIQTQTAGEIKAPPAIEAATRWVDPETKIITSTRIVIATDPQHVVAVTGECVLAPDVAKDIDAACTAALATLDPEILVTSRLPLAIVEKAGPVTPPSQGSAAGPPSATGSGRVVAESSGSVTLGGPSLVESGERPSLPPIQIKPEKAEPDRRPVYVGLGLVMLAIIFYFNRKNREKLERDYENRTAGAPKPESKPKAPDHDADDLHAAAAEDDGTKGTKS
jgi:hypothetical protein